jgi:hypothetical protein
MTVKSRRQDAHLRPTYLYRWYDSEGVLIYIGISVSPRFRAEEHRSSAWWWQWADHMRAEPRPYPRFLAEALERWAVENEYPVFNGTHAQGREDRIVGYLLSRGADLGATRLPPEARGWTRCRGFFADPAAAARAK